MRVTIQQIKSHTRYITREDLEAYLRTKKWEIVYERGDTRIWQVRPGWTVAIPNQVTDALQIRRAIEAIAWEEDRQPYEVLLDIAKLVESTPS